MRSQAEIFTDLRPVLLKLTRRILGSEAEARGMVQEACLRWAQSTAGEAGPPVPPI